MKNKKLTYLLILVVLSVWGLIIYRLLSATGGSDDTIPGPVSQPVKEAYNDFAIPKDTTHLLLNYRDPFGITAVKDTTVNKPNPFKKIISVKPRPGINWGFIQYLGYIRNASSKKLIALLTINGKNEMLAEGQTKDQVKLIRNLRDSVKVSFGGKTKFIGMKGAL